MKFIHPRYWLTWAGYLVLRLIVLLPYPVQMFIGKYLGRLAMYLSRKRRNIARTNLALCFPEWTETHRNKILWQHAESVGKNLLEFGIGYWMSDRRFKPLSHIEGMENLHNALKKGRGAIILAGHFTTLEIICRVLVLNTDFHPMYRMHNNPLIDHIITSNRLRYVSKVIPHDDLRSMLHSLKENNPVLYIPDQNFGRKHSIFVPFFGIQTATIPATSRIASINHTPVLPIIQKRLENNSGYLLVIEKELENFPTNDVYQDIVRINQLFEKQVRDNPVDYLWVHRRFKTRPEGEEPFYK